MTVVESQYPKNSIVAVSRLLMMTVHIGLKRRREEISEIWRWIPGYRIFAEGEFFQGATRLREAIEAHDEEVQALIDQDNPPDVIEASIRRTWPRR